MNVSITRYLEEILSSGNADITSLVKDFHDWKIQGKDGEFKSPLFGKDGAYFKPLVNGEKYALHHVHLPPMLDKQQKKRWINDFNWKRTKTSDRVLVYVKDNLNNYLLITIFSEPDAHEIANMKNKENTDIMNHLAKVAEEFIYNNLIIM